MHPLRHIRPSTRAALIAALGLLAILVALGTAGRSVAAGEGEERPSFLVIQTDDQTLDGLYASFTPYPGAPRLQAMPNTLRLLAHQGMTFNRYYVPYPLCCPSRVSLLTGRYSHNNGVKGNVQPNGGFYGFSFRAAMKHNLATWLDAAGYRTIHVGKFLNGYGDPPYDQGTIVPPGWDAWHTVLNADTQHAYYGYRLNDNGNIDGPFGDPGSWTTREYGVRDDPGCPTAPTNGLPCYYETDVLTGIAAAEMTGTPEGKPFYLQLDYTSPHGDFRRPAGPEPAPRHYDWFKGARLPHDRSEGFDEGNVSDKPRFIREAPHLSPTDKHIYRVYWQKQLDAERSIDDGVKALVETLQALHRLHNTYIIFTSDNGFFFGEHRLIGGKFLAYEPATHLPLLIRGPGVKPNTSTGELAANIDIAPTVLELAGAEADKSIDGRSLVPYLHDPSLRTRRPILFESFVETSDVEANGDISSKGEGDGGHPGGNGSTEKKRKASGSASVSASHGRGARASILAPPKDYEGIRYGPYKYIAWPDGEKELYDINRDPNELNNLARVPNFFPVRNFLHKELTEVYEGCVGRHCSEPAPKLPGTRKEQAVERRKRKKEQHRRERERRRRERERHK